MKTVFTSHEIAHVWVHDQNSSTGRSPGNASFSGECFSSYATVIARKIRHKGKLAFVVDNASFSPTTSKIQHRVRCAIPSSEKVFLVNCGERGQYLDFTPQTLRDFTPQTLRDFYVKQCEEITAETPSRYAVKRAEQYGRATHALREALDVCEFFGLATLSLQNRLNKRATQQEECAKLITEAAEARQRAKALAEKRHLAAVQARNVELAEKFLLDPASIPVARLDLDSPAVQDLTEPLRGQFIAKAKELFEIFKAQWLRGEVNEFPHDWPVMLRVEGTQESLSEDGPDSDAEMVTSKGARVPLADAKRAFLFVMKARAKGWHRNGETFAIGGYHLDAVNDAGIVAGCHRISWEEIERFAKSQNWTA